MQTEYLTLIILGALLILSPFVKSLMERIGFPLHAGTTTGDITEHRHGVQRHHGAAGGNDINLCTFSAAFSTD